MLSRKTILLFLVACSWTVFLPAQQYFLRSYSVSSGLAQSQVYAMCEDSRGVLWFGTQGGGISKFDGISFVTLSSQDGLVNDYIGVIREDRQGNLWIGTDGGISKYNGQQFTTYTRENGLQNNEVHDILQDRAGRFWFATDNGVDILTANGKEPQWVHWNKPEGLLHPTVFSLLEDKQGNIWLGTNGGIYLLPATRIDQLESPELQRFTKENGLAHYWVGALAEDRNERVWIGTYGGGVSVFDPTTHSLTDEFPFKNLTQENGLPNNNITTIAEDRDGNIWLGTIKGGAVRFDGQHFSRFTESSGLLSNSVHHIMEDSWGNVWLGTAGGGVSKFSGDPFRHFTQKTGLPGNRVYAVVQDTLGHLWFGTSAGGVTRFDGLEFTNFRQGEGFTDAVSKAMIRDAKGHLWFGTEGDGMYRFDGVNFTHFDLEQGLSNRFVKAITEDQYGNLWLATAGGGINKYDGTTFTVYRTREGLSNNRTLDIVEDPEGAIWIATENGLSRFSKGKFENFFRADGVCAQTIRSLALDEKGNLWLGTSEGLNKVTREEGEITFTCISKEDGLSSNNIYLTRFDVLGNLWVGNEKGVDKISFNPEGNIKEIRQFGAAEGFSGIETCQRAAYNDEEGNIWFGTINGLTMHTPAENTVNEQPPKTHVTSVRLFYEKIDSTPYADSTSAWYALPQGLVLPHRQNHLSFEFIGINHKNPEKVTYTWRLHPYEETWRPAVAKTEATYSNLEPGEYTFYVKAFNEDGISNDTPQEFSFVIRPPVWQKLWFRIVAILVVVILMYLIFQWRINQIKKKNEAARKKAEMDRNLIELEQKALRLQMNPHFIFNALNSIKGCMAMDDTAAARKYLVKFARLMRLILDNSRTPYISIETEVQTLALYLEIEKLSKSDSFVFEIGVDPEVDREGMGIPPMLVQPFVENAILHGVASLENGLIQVNFKKEGDLLRCVIEDNGVGRERAAELQVSLGKEHKSTATTVTEERLALLESGTETHYRVNIIDLKDDTGEPTGTRVELTMPFVDL